MIRSALFILLMTFSGLVLTPQNAVAQSVEAEAQETSEQIIIHNEDDIEQAYRAIKRNADYQMELAEPIPRRPASAFEKWLGKVFSAIGNFLIPLIEILFWLGAGALVLGALYLIGRAIYETRFAKPAGKTEDTPDIPLYQPAQAQARILLDEVDKLAAEGRYGEAVHTLLFRSIQDIDRNRPNVVRRSLTAREIGSLSILTSEARTAFSTIAGVSELAHFGGVAVNEAGFETARAAYADLTGQTAAPRKTRR